MDDPDDPVVAEKDVPSYGIFEKKVRDIDSTIIIFRVYYFFTTRLYRFQLIKKDKMCMLDIPRMLLESAGDNGTPAARELGKLLDVTIEDAECWKDFEG
jgi:hypothetical protein